MSYRVPGQLQRHGYHHGALCWGNEPENLALFEHHLKQTKTVPDIDLGVPLLRNRTIWYKVTGSLYCNIAARVLFLEESFMLRFFALLVCLLGALLGPLPDGFAQEENKAKSPNKRPNIVFIISDDHDYEHLGFMGHPFAKTPEIDALAASGFVFNLAHLPMSRCRPTLASMLSGLHPHQNGIYYNYGTQTLPGSNSLPMLLRDAGYATFGSGKYWEGDPRVMGFTHGKGRTASRFVRQHQDDALNFLEEVGSEKPFFMWWAPKLPHRPHNAPERFKQLYNPADFEVPEWVKGPGSHYRAKEHNLLAATSWLDEGIGDLMAKLRERKLLQNTIVVFLIDNGWSNGLPSKGTPFEKGLRTPIILSWPAQIPKGKSTDVLVSTLDLFPTLLDYARVSPPTGLPGRSLRDVIQGKTKSGRTTLYGAIYPAISTMEDEAPERDVYALYARDERWKYIRYVQDVRESDNASYLRIQTILADFPSRTAGQEDLFDLEADPYELHNLSNDPSLKNRLADMRQRTFSWWKETGGKPIRHSPQEKTKKKKNKEKTQEKLGQAKRPNIIIILADDLGYGDLGSYGQKKIKTPVLDRMAKEGIRFTQHYAGSSVGAPSRCALLTGLHTGHAYVRDKRAQPSDGQLAIPADTQTIATVLKKVGYRTGFIGKWGLGDPGSTGVPNHVGFDSFYGFLNRWRAQNHFPKYLWRDEKKEEITGNLNGKKTNYSGDLFTAESLAFINKNKKEEPFLLFLSFASPHASLEAPQDALKPYVGKWRERPYKSRYFRRQQKPRAAFAAMVSRMDQNIGRIFACLKKNHIEQDTLIIFSSDNGPSWEGGSDGRFFRSTGPFRGKKGTHLEGGIRVPFLVRWPAQIGAMSEAPLISASWDLLPTLAEIAKAPIPKDLDGESMLPTFFGFPEEQDEHDYLYWEFSERHQAVRLGRWKADRGNHSPQVRLFDVENDPAESKDLGLRRLSEVRRMKAIMKEARTPSEIFDMQEPRLPKLGANRDERFLTRKDLLSRRNWKFIVGGASSDLSDPAYRHAIDSDPTTIWFTDPDAPNAGHPYDLVVDLGQSATIQGIRYLSRRNGNRGLIKEFSIRVSQDPKHFPEAIFKGSFGTERTEQERTWKPLTGRYVQLRILSSHENSKLASIAEFGFIGRFQD